MAIYLNNKEVEAFVFPGGECHVRIDIDSLVIGHNVIKAYLLTSDDILKLLLCVDAIRRAKPNAIIDLVIPYFPYARQDRVALKGEAFSLDVMATLINSLRVQSVTILDPHSEKTEQLVKNCCIIPQEIIIKESPLFNFIKDKKLDLVAPDKGSYNKVNKLKLLLNKHNYSPYIITSLKKRDPNSGDIIEIALKGEVKPVDYILVDDICDGGQTFIKLASLLKKQGAKRLYLYVTHGIFSKGLDVLHEDFHHVFCYHTYLKSYDKTFLTVFNDSYI